MVTQRKNIKRVSKKDIMNLLDEILVKPKENLKVLQGRTQ